MQSKLLQEVANTLLKDTQDFFQLGSINNPSVMQSNEQFTFINKIRVDFLKKYEEVEKGAQFFFKFSSLPKEEKISFRKKGDLEKYYQACIKENNLKSTLTLLQHIYDYKKIKEAYKKLENKDWRDDWLNDSPQIFAESALEKRYLQEAAGDPKRAIQMTLFDGIGNCEPMAEYCLMMAIEKNKSLNLNCAVHYIRFPECENYEELNVLVLGEWPNKGCQIICPWLGSITEWQGSLKETKAFAHYNDFKIIFKVKVGKEMNTLSQDLQEIPFTEQTTNASKKSAEDFKQKAKEFEKNFNTYFPELKADSSYHYKR